jgi:ketosteroid isomerase-like protein
MDLLSAIAEGDREALSAMVSDDVVYHSPGTTYRGRDQVVDVLRVAPHVLASLTATREAVEIGAGGTLTFPTATVEDEELHGVLIEARDEAGRVAEITWYLRPLRGVVTAVRHLARALAETGEAGA